jgi:hypothetical protein
MGTRGATRGAEAEFEPTHEQTATGSVSRSNSVVCTENLNSGVLVMESAKDGA